MIVKLKNITSKLELWQQVINHQNIFIMADLEIRSFDAIVIGLGGHGSATVAALAKNYPEWKILGIEKYTPCHSKGRFNTGSNNSLVYGINLQVLLMECLESTVKRILSTLLVSKEKSCYFAHLKSLLS